MAGVAITGGISEKEPFSCLEVKYIVLSQIWTRAPAKSWMAWRNVQAETSTSWSVQVEIST